MNSDQQGSELNSATDSAKHQKCSRRHKAVMKLKEEQTLKGHNGRVWGCSWSPSGNLLATCGEDANVRYDHCLDYESLLLLLRPYSAFFFQKEQE